MYDPSLVKNVDPGE